MLGNKSSLLNAIGLGDQRSSGDLSQSGKVVFATTTLAMDVNDQVVRCVTNDTLGFTVTLPSVRAAAGRMYSISLVTDGGMDVTIENKANDSVLTDITLDTALDYALMYSDGYLWHTLLSESS
jgi:hypothetical protein